MATGSTKQRARKRAAQTNSREASGARAGSGAGVADAATGEAADVSFISQRAWTRASLAVMAVAAFVRLYALELKPLHHDEGVNGFFLTRLVREGVYQYDPANYHGPTLYYFALLPAYLLETILGTGMTTFAVRLVPALCGLATVWLALCLRRYVGALGALTAAALIAVSPGAVYNSRYFIHEALFVFFTLGIVVAALNFYERKRPTMLAYGALAFTSLVVVLPVMLYLSNRTFHKSLTRFLAADSAHVLHVAFAVALSAVAVWLVVSSFTAWREEGARPVHLLVYLLLAFTSAALLFATKETAFISVGVLVLAAGVAWAVAKFWGRTTPLAPYGDAHAGDAHALSRTGGSEAGAVVARFGGSAHLLLMLAAGVALFVCLNVLFYSSFLTYREGLAGAIETFKIWTKTGTSEFHRKSPETYLIWLLKEEAPILALALVGAFVSVFERRTNRFAVFASAWAFGILVAYSLVPYKTPWLALNFVVPLAIAGGYGVERAAALWRRKNARRAGGELQAHAPAPVLAAVAVSICLAQTLVLNFYQYDNDKYPYVYAHTKREFTEMMTEVERLAAQAGTKKETKIAVASPDYWPLPWYLRDYKNTGFFGQVNAFSEPIVIGNLTQQAQLQATLGNRYRLVGKYPLRPGVELVLFASHEIAAAR